MSLETEIANLVTATNNLTETVNNQIGAVETSTTNQWNQISYVITGALLTPDQENAQQLSDAIILFIKNVMFLSTSNPANIVRNAVVAGPDLLRWDGVGYTAQDVGTQWFSLGGYRVDIGGGMYNYIGTFLRIA